MKRVNNWGRKSGEIPWPESETVMSTWELTRLRKTWTRPLRGVNLTELERRFQRICWRGGSLAVTPVDGLQRLPLGIEDFDEANTLGFGGGTNRFDGLCDDDDLKVNGLDVEPQLAIDDA